MKRADIAKCPDAYSLRDYYRACPENKGKSIYAMEQFIKITLEKRARKGL